MNKLSIEDRQQAALDSIEEGSYLVYRGETYRGLAGSPVL